MNSIQKCTSINQLDAQFFGPNIKVQRNATHYSAWL
ncbi:hypothetical protein HMPREF9702_01633 [Delftia acidovorans CCUG 15835]|nr:hypothetical protein HMPREF9702_01633 [Delftia acidovorans CCUG 15835]